MSPAHSLSWHLLKKKKKEDHQRTPSNTLGLLLYTLGHFFNVQLFKTNKQKTNKQTFLVINKTTQHMAPFCNPQCVDHLHVKEKCLNFYDISMSINKYSK